MHRTFSAAKLDFYAGKSMLRVVVVLVLIAVTVGMAVHGPDYAMMLVMVFGVTSGGSVFSVHEKSHSDKLYGILPLKKSEMIMGRYLYALAIGVAYIILAAILGFIIARVTGTSVSALNYWATLAVGFTYFGFATGVAFPLYFKFSFAKAYVFTMIPMYLLAVLFLIVTRKTNFVSNLGQIARFFTAHLYLAPLCGLVGGLLLLAISALISNALYTGHEI